MLGHNPEVTHVDGVISISLNEEVENILMLHLDSGYYVAVDLAICDILIGGNNKVKILTKETQSDK